jgi:hypothetical protein
MNELIKFLKQYVPGSEVMGVSASSVTLRVRVACVNEISVGAICDYCTANSIEFVIFSENVLSINILFSLKHS